MLDLCLIKSCVLGLRLRVEEGVLLVDTLAMGADGYEAEAERSLVRPQGGVPLGTGAGSTVKKMILDMNVRIGSYVQVINRNHIHEADRSEPGFTIRNGIVVIEKNTTMADGVII